MEQYVEILRIFHSAGYPLDDITEVFMEQMDDFFENLEKVSGSWTHMAEQKRKMFDDFVYIVEEKTFLEWKSPILSKLLL